MPVNPVIQQILELFDSLSDEEQLHVADLIEEEYGIELFIHESPPVAAEGRINVRVTDGAIRHNYLSINQQFDFFPDDVVGRSNQPAARQITLHIFGYAEPVKTDVKKRGTFRARCWSDFYADNNIQDGDYVVIERLGDYEYRVTPMM